MTDRRQQILDAALAIADQGGLDAVSMRAVAQRVGVTAMALYPHFNGKDALLDALTGRVLAELALPDPAEPWQDRLRGLGHALRDLAHRHPAVAPLLFSRPAAAPDAVRVIGAVYQALHEAGVPGDQVARMERMLSTFVLGYAISEIGGRFAAPGTHQTTPPSWDTEFDADLTDLTNMIHGSPSSWTTAPAVSAPS